MVAGHLRLLFVTDERAVALQDEVAGTPCFDVFTWEEEERVSLLDFLRFLKCTSTPHNIIVMKGKETFLIHGGC